MTYIWAAFFALLCLWITFVAISVTMRRRGSPEHPWSWQRWLWLVTGVLVFSGSLWSAVGFARNQFNPAGFIPLGISYLLMMPLDCYFKWVTATRRRYTIRNGVFLAIAAVFFGVGFRVIPLSWMGL